ncbi:MAG: class I SAM-dependent methyltransferase [Candidatus Acidiferrum sp.]
MSPHDEAWCSTLVPEEFLRRGAPSISTEDIPACPVCGASQFETFAVGFDYEYLTCRNPWRFVQCRECQHVWLHPRPAVTELSVIYPPTYYAYNYETLNPVARKAKELLDHRKIAGIVRHCPAPPRSYLDVGCGNGRVLRVMEGRGVPRAALYGLELDERVVNNLREQGYTGVLCERAEAVTSFPEGGIDLATMFHVIEHVDNPAAVVSRIRRWLSPGGIFALETPSLESWDAHLFHRTYWGGYHIPRHWNLFTPGSIARLLQNNGLEVLATLFLTGHSFWMYSLHHVVRFKGGSRPRSGTWFNPNRSLVGVAGFTALDLLRSSLGAKTSAMLVICRKPA